MPRSWEHTLKGCIQIVMYNFCGNMKRRCVSSPIHVIAWMDVDAVQVKLEDAGFDWKILGPVPWQVLACLLGKHSEVIYLTRWASEC